MVVMVIVACWAIMVVRASVMHIMNILNIVTALVRENDKIRR